MMGLTDRIEPWARRFQRAPGQPATAEPVPARRRTTTGPFARPDREASAEPAEPAELTGRFTRRAPQEQ